MDSPVRGTGTQPVTNRSGSLHLVCTQWKGQGQCGGVTSSTWHVLQVLHVGKASKLAREECHNKV